jgi:hypothetical protein
MELKQDRKQDHKQNHPHHYNNQLICSLIFKEVGLISLSSVSIFMFVDVYKQLFTKKSLIFFISLIQPLSAFSVSL